MKHLYLSISLLAGEAYARIAAQETSTSDQGTVTVHQEPPRQKRTIQTHQSLRASKTYASNGARERERRMRKLAKKDPDNG